MRNNKSLILAILFIMVFQFAFSQNRSFLTNGSGGLINPMNGTINPGDIIGKDAPNAITTAAPFLIIAPDSRAGAMGDAGVATSPDVHSMHWNPAKYAFVEKDMGFGISYTPWLRNLVNDINMSYIAFYKRIGKKELQTISASLLYFSLGNITFTNDYGEAIFDYSPHEFAIDAAYSFKMSKFLSGGIAMRYIHSSLTGGAGGVSSHPGRSIAADISTYYQRDINLGDIDSKLAFGFNASNIGSRISYTDDAIQNYIPINLRIGTALTLNLDDFNQLAFTVDLNKLMVPTPPKYVAETDDEIEFGKDPNVAVARGIFQSFYDAPGVPNSSGERSVFKEEMREITYSAGVEYWYAKQFAVRGGYFHEHATKGNRKYFTIGFGLKLNIFGLDFAYLVPTNAQNSPLANTLRFSLIFDIEGFEKEASPNK